LEAFMSTNNEFTSPVAALMLPVLNKPLLTYSRAVHKALLNNPAFPSPNPPLSVLAANIDAFEDAETQAATRARGAASFRDSKKKRVKENLFHIRDYVQSVVETSNPADATALIESAFMSVRKVPTRTYPEISAKRGDVSGKVLLAAKSVAPKAVYRWEYSMDQETWTRLHARGLAGFLPGREPARHLAASSRSASLWPATNCLAAGRRRRTPATSAPLASAPSARINACR
jgi:hypothetical protein